jgi:hypothetical protein
VTTEAILRLVDAENPPATWPGYFYSAHLREDPQLTTRFNNHCKFGNDESKAGFHAATVAPEAAFTAARITSITRSGWESIGTWLLSSS